MLLGLVVILFLMRLGIERHPEAPPLAADCEKPAFALSAARVAMGGPISYTMVGPAGRRYVLGVDTETFVERDGAWEPVPRPGYEPVRSAEDGPMPDGCTRSGFFAIPGPLGEHTVTMYELTDRGTVFVAQQDVEVVERQP